MSINNTRSYTEYTVTQPTTDFAIGFDDFDEGSKDIILVTLNGVLVETIGYAAIRKNESTVSITPAITEGTVRLTRETDIDEPFHKFTAGALFSAKSMDENFQQVRHSQQEVRDGFVFLEYNTNGIVEAAKVATTAALVAAEDVQEATTEANNAAAGANVAAASAQAAVQASTTATATANTAASQATAATTSAQNAALAATVAEQEATTATANAQAAIVDTLAATDRAIEAAELAENTDVVQLQIDLEAQKLDTGIIATAKFGGVEREQSAKNTDILTPMDFGASDNKLKSLLSVGIEIPENIEVMTDDAGRFGVVPLATGLPTAGGSYVQSVTAQAIDVTVGVGGDFTTINNALQYLGSMRRTYGEDSKASITLLSGFVMAEQIIIDNKELGWIEIKSIGAIVNITAAAITKTLTPVDAATPIFGAINNAVLPIISVLFDYGSNATAKDGVAVYNNSTCFISPDCGVRNCRRGIQAYHGSRVICGMDGLRSAAGTGASANGVDFRNCSGRALDVQQGSFASLPRSNFNGCQADYAVYLIWGATANLYQSQARNAVGSAFTARDGSVLCIRECDMDNAGNRAVHALHGAFIDARAKTSAKVYGTHGAKNCKGSIAVLANGGCIIEAAELNVSGGIARGFTAEGGSIISATLANADNCATYGFCAVNGSTIDANTSTAKTCDIGYYADAASTINAVASDASSSSFGVLAENLSSINITNGVLNSCARAVESRSGANVNAKSATCNNSATRTFSIIDGGNANISGATSTGAVGFHLTLRGGGRVTAYGYNGSIDLREGGGIVHNGLGTGSVSQTVNTITSQGIIFR